MKVENMLQRFSCISFLFKPPCYDLKFLGIRILEKYKLDLSTKYSILQV